MDAQVNPKDEDTIRSFVEKLKSARRSAAGRPEDDLREALKQAADVEKVRDQRQAY